MKKCEKIPGEDVVVVVVVVVVGLYDTASFVKLPFTLRSQPPTTIILEWRH